MNTVTVREAVKADMPSVMKLIGQSDMSPDNELTLAQADELFEKITATGYHRLYVAELDSSIVGTFALVVVQQLSHNGARSVILEDIVVRSDLQGHGIGNQIMKSAIDRAQALGCYKICLSSGKAREQAHAFYEKLGYDKDGFRFAMKLKEENKSRDTQAGSRAG
jgi:GNAT superfamily N-acetyltransferase